MPNKVIRFLSLDEALTIHERLLEKFGGPAGVRDLGLLDSALFRPQTGYYDDLVGMSAALFESLLMNHPFVDGKKRAGFFMTDTFLRINGYKLVVEAHAAHKFIVDLLERHVVAFNALGDWIRLHTQRLG